MTSKLLNGALIQSIVHRDKGLDCTMCSWYQEPCSKDGSQTFNVTVRIVVTYSKNSSTYTCRYVAKVNPQKEQDIFNPYRHHAMKKEIFFYQDLLPLLNEQLDIIGQPPLRVPKCVQTSCEYGREILVFEDLQELGFTTRERKYPLDESHAKAMTAELARFSAASHHLLHKYHQIVDKFPLLEETWNLTDPALSEGFSKLFAKGVQFSLVAASQISELEALLPWLESLAERPMEAIKTQLRGASKFTAICHGDFHRTNVMFRYDDAGKPVDIRVIDWQTLRLSCYGMELGYLICNTFWSENKIEIQDCIYNSYFESLNQLIPSNLPFTKAQFIDHVKNNHFGLMLCFYLIPLSFSVNDPSELFINSKPEPPHKIAEVVASLLKNKPSFKAMMEIYANEIKQRNLPAII